MTLYKWSQTASTDATADGTINWAEGQSPSSVNDSARAMMAATAKYRDDIAGAIVTGGGPTAYTVSSNQVFDTLAHLNGQMIAFVPHVTNTNTVGTDVTLNVDSLGVKPIRSQPSVALPNGSLVAGTPYVVTFNNADAVFYLQGMTNPYNVPLAAGMDFWGTTAPNTSFAFPIGQAISRTTYATLYAIMGTTYGVGDGSTTFNLPDKTGRVSAMKEAVATRLTATYFGASGATLGSVGGGEASTILQANLPNVNFTVASGITVSVTSSNVNIGTSGAGTSGIPSNTANAPSSIISTGSTTSTGTAASGGSGTPLRTVPPTIVCNYIIRII